MAYQQNQPQLQSYQRPGIGQSIGQQPPQFQQPQFQQQPPQVQGQQQPAIAGQGSQPTQWQTPQQTGSIPQQAAQFPQQSSYAVPPTSTQQGFSQQLPQAQQPTPPRQPLGQLQPQVSFGQLQPQGQFGQLQPQQVGQFGTPPTVSSQSVPQGQTAQVPQQAQVPQMQGQQLPQQLGQQIPQQAQWGTQASGQPTGQSATSLGQSSIGQSVRSGAQSLPSQMPEFGAGSIQQVGEQAQQRLAGTPSVDIVDTPDEIVLFVDLPGYEEEDIKIQADGQNLTVSAERRGEEQEEGRKYARERPQKLQRTVRLPTRANVNEADATYENGVCKITLPKMEEDKQHEIAFQ